MKYKLLSLCLLSAGVNAAPFDTCPSKAFLVQGNTAAIYGVNLVSGAYTEFAPNVGTNNKLNGFGFNLHDRYLYGWDYSRKDIGRVGNDYTLEPLTTVGFPDTNFYVGDVAIHENAYYVYRKGSSYGLYRVSLDESSNDYLQATRVINGGDLNLNIFDMAFAPNGEAGMAYSVDSNGNLHRINATTGASTVLGNVGQSGTFGAVYFDVDNNFYISRNQDGHIYQVNIEDPADTQLFAYGPSSGSNDGARCATAPIIDESEDPTMDYGDAPESYGTSLAENGARHVAGDLYFGDGVSAEHLPKAQDDDDGVSFVTSIETGYDALISFTLSTNGYVNAWVDWNQDGEFQSSERIISELSGVAGENRVLIPVPVDALEGNTWARFRVSNNQDIAPTGGVDNGEVEDIAVSVVASSLIESSTAWQTAAFEDLWPQKGDYDFNDVVVRYRATTGQIGNQIVQYKVEGALVAVGAGYHNAFALRFKDIARNHVNESQIKLTIDGVEAQNSPLEANRNEAIAVIFKDTREMVPALEGCKFFRTEEDCIDRQRAPVPFELILPLSTTYSVNVATLDKLDPFIFAVTGYDHGPYVDSNNGRGWEVHLKNQAPTEAFDPSYLDQGDDTSSTNGYFQTNTGLPWAMIINTDWQHPKEKTDMSIAYPQFAEFASSAGQNNVTWFENPVANYQYTISSASQN
ncbi:LruC domain-containing protein [Pseudoalteromonas luteoviolacea]|uniref:LruC domain-containing protein n=1 Tax=Pseudoalteromonas luteoviolacea TaxID=43657 RepID=UPI001B3A70DA|nr:LruC domain-containing protein [Pseudoalteromonas luteoviolacea]MBQ4877757.1 LruC domain-containing protein [Pseudoalteromonas luteoviolacea]MBQ4906797.1 LruC domain-containing protein [Pseudoalteromonas luteoviolacea]